MSNSSVAQSFLSAIKRPTQPVVSTHLAPDLKPLTLQVLTVPATQPVQTRVEFPSFLKPQLIAYACLGHQLTPDRIVAFCLDMAKMDICKLVKACLTTPRKHKTPTITLESLWQNANEQQRHCIARALFVLRSKWTDDQNSDVEDDDDEEMQDVDRMKDIGFDLEVVFCEKFWTPYMQVWQTWSAEEFMQRHSNTHRLEHRDRITQNMDPTEYQTSYAEARSQSFVRPRSKRNAFIGWLLAGETVKVKGEVIDLLGELVYESFEEQLLRRNKPDQL